MVHLSFYKGEIVKEGAEKGGGLHGVSGFENCGKPHLKNQYKYG